MQTTPSKSINPKSSRSNVPESLLVFTMYFAEGFPFVIIRSVSSVFFRDMGMSLEYIGLTSLFGLPWAIKFLWSPQIDAYATKRQWLLFMQCGLLAVFLTAPFLTRLSCGLQAIAVLFFMGSFLAATHDTAIDGYYMESFSPESQARWVGYRVMAYRIAMMTGTGVIVKIGVTAGWGWFSAFLCAGVLFGCLFFLHIFLLPNRENYGKPISELISTVTSPKNILLTISTGLLVGGLYQLTTSEFYKTIQEASPVLKKISFAEYMGGILFAALACIYSYRANLKEYLAKKGGSNYGRAFLSFMDRDRIGIMLAFIVLIRTGEFMLSSMATPFIMDLGLKAHYSWISAWVGLPASIAGAMAGGWLIARYSLSRTIWPLLIAQNGTNLLYMALAFLLTGFLDTNTGTATPVFIGTFNLVLVAVVNGFDQFAGGLGTAVLTTYLLRLSAGEFKAAHYAIGTGLMSISGLYAGVISGFLASWLGYGLFFGVSFIMSLPGMAMVFFLPMLEKDSGKVAG